MSSFREEVYDLLYGYVRIWQSGSGRWAAALDPEVLGDWINPMPPGQCYTITGGGADLFSELDLLEGEQRRQALVGDKHSSMWAARPFFKSHETATWGILGWIRANRRDLLQNCVNEAKAGRAYRAMKLRKMDAHD